MMMALVYVSKYAEYLNTVKLDMAHVIQSWNSVIELDQSKVSVRLVKNQLPETSLASAQASLQERLMSELPVSNQIMNSVRSRTLYRF